MGIFLRVKNCRLFYLYESFAFMYLCVSYVRLIILDARRKQELEKEEHSFIPGGIAHWYNHSGNPSRGFLRKLELDLSEDPSIPSKVTETKCVAEVSLHRGLQRTLC